MNKPKIAIIIGSTRTGRFADTPAAWLLDIANRRTDADFEIVDLRDYPMPFFEGAALVYAPVTDEHAKRWAAKIAEFDGYVFLVAEYNHSITGVLKNAIDHLYSEIHRKPAAFVGYGGTGGARAVEHLRNILAELHVATLKSAVHMGATELIGVMREGKTLEDYPYLAQSAMPMLDDLIWWARTLRQGRDELAGIAQEPAAYEDAAA